MEIKMSKYSPIYKYLKQQKKLDKKINKLHWKLEALKYRRRDLQKPFWGGDLDPELYKDFFKHYCIKLQHQGQSTHSIYTVTDILLDFESTHAQRPFWKAQYDFKQYHNDTLLQHHKGSLSLRGLLDILLQPGASLEKL